MVWQEGSVAASWQSSTVVFQGQDIQTSTRHDAGQLCAHVDVTGGESSLNMVSWNYQNLAGTKLKGGAEAYLSGFSKV